MCSKKKLNYHQMLCRDIKMYGIFTNSPPLKDFNNLSNDVFSGAANAFPLNNKPRTTIPKSFFILNIVYKFLHVEFFPYL